MAEFSENEAPKNFDWMPEGCVPLAGESVELFTYYYFLLHLYQRVFFTSKYYLLI